jgi:hypothetical protein
MSLRDIIKRTRARKKAGANQRYPQHAGKATSLPVVAATPAPAAEVKPESKLPDKPCAYRGLTAIRSEECGGCRKRTQLKVFPCAVFGECTIAKPHAKAKGCCKGCDKYVAPAGEVSVGNSG